MNYVFVNFFCKCMHSVSFCRLKPFSAVFFKTRFNSLKYFSSNRQPALNDDFITEKSKSSIRTIGRAKTEPTKVKKKSAENELKHRMDENELISIIESIDSSPSLNDTKDVIITALKKNEGGIYLIDPASADLLSNLIASELNDSDTLLIEANPGLGLLTRRLLASGISYVRLFESNLSFFEHLKNEQFPGVVDIHHKDIIRFWKMQFMDRKDGGKRVSRIFTGITAKDWEDDPVVRVVAAIPDIKFICNIIDNVVTQTGFVKHGRPEFFLVMDPFVFHLMAKGQTLGYKNYRSYCVLFQAIFDYQVLSIIPRNAYLPSDKYKKFSRTRKEFMEKEGHKMYVVKVTPKRDLYSNDLGRVLPTFSYFVKQLFSSCSKRIIPQLEQWLPGCGPKMIAEGYDIYTEVGELSPKDIHDIFLKFLSLTEASESSTFFVSMDSYLLKKEDSADEHDNEQKLL